MNRIDAVFKRLKQEQKTAFIGFLTAGDPDIPTCMECVKQLEQNGCDIIEIGIPFSDPIAEGPVIQEASLRALQNDITTETVMRMVSNIREFSQIPLVFLLYYNQIFKYGANRFLRESEAAGIDALIIPDLPMEHREELKPLADAHHIQLISLVTPVSSVRKKSIAEQSEGFLYCVTSLGVTGERTEFQADLKAFLRAFRLQQYAKGTWLRYFHSTADYRDEVLCGRCDCRQCHCAADRATGEAGNHAGRDRQLCENTCGCGTCLERDNASFFCTDCNERFTTSTDVPPIPATFFSSRKPAASLPCRNDFSAKH